MSTTFQQALNAALAQAPVRLVVARTAERISAADGDILWHQEYTLAVGDGAFRAALIEVEYDWHRQLTDWGQAAILVKRRINRNRITGAIRYDDWWVTALADTPFAALWETVESDLDTAASLHPIHAFFVTQDAERKVLREQIGALKRDRKEQEALTDEHLSYEYGTIRGGKAQQALREARLLKAVEENRAPEAKLAPVRAKLRAEMEAAKVARDARLAQLAIDLPILEARLADLAEGNGAPAFVPQAQQEEGVPPSPSSLRAA